MSTGIELSMFLAGMVTVTKASLPTCCAWIVATAAGMRRIGASGGPFFPHAATTKAATTKAATAARHEAHEDLATTKDAKITKVYYQILLRVLRVLRGFPPSWFPSSRARYSASACSAGRVSASGRRTARRPPADGRKRRTSTPRLRTL